MDTTLFSDVADALGIQDTAIVEKDYYAVQLLKQLNALEQNDYRFIFSGGTCLSKAYQHTFRMSEDLDIKLVPNDTTLTKKDRKKLGEMIMNDIKASEMFELAQDPFYRDVRRVQLFTIAYPKTFESSSLRPHLKLECVEKVLYQPTNQKPIASMLHEATNELPEIENLECVNLESIVAEKLVSLLWRTSALANAVDIVDDPALIRHLYDIHLIMEHQSSVINQERLNDIAQQVLSHDADKYINKFNLFQTPTNVILHGLDELQNNSMHQQRYKQFVHPLVYSISPPTWEDSFASVTKITQEVFTCSS